MAVAFGAVGTIATDTSTTGYSVSYPSGITAGQKLILAVFGRDSDGSDTLNNPSGWTVVTNAGTSASNSNWIKVYTKVAVGTETGSVALTFNTQNSASRSVILRYTTSLGSWDPDAAGNGVDTSSGWVMTTGQSIQRTSGDMLIAFASGSGSGSRTWSNEEIDGQAGSLRAEGVTSSCHSHISDATTSTSATSTVLHAADLNSNFAGPGVVLRLHDYTAGGGHTDKRIWGSIPIKADS